MNQKSHFVFQYQGFVYFPEEIILNILFFLNLEKSSFQRKFMRLFFDFDVEND